MTEYPKLKEIYDEIIRCYRCGLCRATCPSCFHNLYSTSMLMDCKVKIVTLEELIGYATRQLEKVPYINSKYI